MSLLIRGGVKMITIETIRDQLKSLAEDRTMPMDVQVYNALWQMIQSIDVELEEGEK